MNDHPVLTIEQLVEAVSDATAIRRVSELHPVGGDRDKVFPPTYMGGVYAEEHRLSENGEYLLTAVLLHSVAGQANLMEDALAVALEEARRASEPTWAFPVPTVDLSGTAASRNSISILEAPHRIFDAIFRDSLCDGKAFAESKLGRDLEKAFPANATSLFEYCPTALLFGAWNSTKAVRGNAKFPRCIVSEIVGLNAQKGVGVGGRVDPIEITRMPLYATDDGPFDYTANPAEALPELDEKGEVKKDKEGNPILRLFKVKKDGRMQPAFPSDINHGNIPPEIRRAKKNALDAAGDVLAEARTPIGGGVTIQKALQTTVLSFAALRRLRFPNGNGMASPDRDGAARTVLAALGLVAITAVRDYFLRSRCDLHVKIPSPFELIRNGESVPKKFSLSHEQALPLLATALKRAAELDPPLRWKAQTELPGLKPSQKLRGLIEEAQKRAGIEEAEPE